MDYQYKKNNGFTLIEVIVALGLFSLVISVAVGAFASGSSSQRKALELYLVQREGGYIMETISRELRMTKGIDAGEANTYDSAITFTDYNNATKTYCLSDINGNCNVNGEYFSIDNNRMSSQNVVIESLRFYINNVTDSRVQKFVTIALKIKARGSQQAILLQTTIAMRIYNFD